MGERSEVIMKIIGKPIGRVKQPGSVSKGWVGFRPAEKGHEDTASRAYYALCERGWRGQGEVGAATLCLLPCVEGQSASLMIVM